jgi:trans-aconitate methyltransferase
VGIERGHEYYDKVFSSSGLYLGDIKSAPWFDVWSAVSDLIISAGSPPVIDLGCGPGHLAEVLSSRGYRSQYVGYDFSSVAIADASARDVQSARFEQLDLRDCNMSDFDHPDDAVYVAIEFLEHVEWDIEILSSIPAGRTVIGTVPNFDDPGHVRHFTRLSDAVVRYSDAITVSDARRVGGSHFIFSGRRPK